MSSASQSTAEHRGVPPPGPWRRLDVIACSVMVNLLALALPFVTLQVYDRILPNQAEGTLAMLMSLLVVVTLLDAVLRTARSIILSWEGARFEHEQTLRLLDHLLRSNLLSFESRSYGHYLDRLQGLEKVREFYCGQAMLTLVELPFAVLFVFMIYGFAGNLVLVPLGFILVFVLISYVMGNALKRALELQSTMDERRQNFLIEALSGIHTVKSMAMEAPMTRRYERLQAQSADSVYDLSRINGIVQGLGATFSQVLMVSFVAIGSVQVVADQLTVGALAAGTMLSGRVLQPALKAMGLWTHLQGVRVARDKLESLLALPREAMDDVSGDRPLSGRVTLENLRFRHDGGDAELIAGIDLDVAPGEWIGITGDNGCGKSTLLNLIIGFMSPAAGRVLLDGQEISSLDRSSVRAQIGLMPQRGAMFEGTILENITVFRQGACIGEALELVRELGLDADIRKLPEGLDTKVGRSMADNLSEGMRNRIIIARAIIGSPPVLLFDDANACFDMHNDGRLMGLLERFKGQRTMIMVSHRPSLLRMCDRRFRMDGGRLVALDDAQGAPEQRPAPAFAPRAAVETPA